jgi:hypothetical protein
MTDTPRREPTAAVLKHPFVLAGLAVVGLLALTAAVLVVVDSLRGDTGADPAVAVEPKGTATAGPVSKTAEAGGIRGITKSTTAVRFAPGEQGSVLGTLPRDAEVQIDGRTTDSLWVRVIFPRGSEQHGWIDASLLTITGGDVETLVVATAEPPIIVDVPTVPPNVTPEVEATPDLTLTPEGTPTAGGLPDLVIGTPPTISDGVLFVSVVNQGPGDYTGDLVVAVFNFDGTLLLGGATVPGFTLAAGTSINVGTGYRVEEDQTLTLVVDPNGDTDEVDNTNNRVTISVAVEAQPTEQPIPFETPPPPPAQ